jgi:DnaA-homolog protein
MSVTEQMVLPLATEFSRNSFASFYPGKNAPVLLQLKKMLSDESDRVIYLAGANASGRSHLLQAVSSQFLEAGRQALYISLADMPDDQSQCLQGLAEMDLLCIDDLHAVISKNKWQEALFHLYNQTSESGCKLLFAANKLPQDLGCSLPDLQSRLQWGLVLQLRDLDDEEKKQALILRAKQRGVEFPLPVADYLLRHFSRDMGELMHLFECIDKTIWQTKKRLTVPLVKEVISQFVYIV